MLKAFIDDSCMGQPPIYVLSGWVAPAATWARFSDAWADVLRMSPRIEYFKFSEAMNLKGEFYGLSEASRDEKLGLLLRVIEDHQLLGVASIIPHKIFDRFFGKHPDPNINNPYFPSLFGVVTTILRHNKAAGIEDRLEVFFDYQPGSDQMQKIISGWDHFVSNLPADIRPLIQKHPPAFLNDQDIVGLQAADLHAGWARTTGVAKLEPSGGFYWPWGDRDINIPTVKYEWTEELAAALFEDMFGIPPVTITFTFGYGYRPKGVLVE